MLRPFLIIISIYALVACERRPPEEGYRIARDPEWSRVVLMGREKAVLAFSDDLVREIAADKGFKVRFFPGNWDAMQQYLLAEEADGILSGIPPEPPYREVYDFSNIYLQTGPVLVVPIGSNASSLKEMSGKTLGVRTGSDARLVAAEVPMVVIHTFPSEAVALDRLEKGQIDGALLPAIPAYAFVSDLYSGSLKVVTPPLTNEGLRLIVLKGEQDKLIKWFNEGLRELQRSSKYNELQEKWRLHLDVSEGS